MISGTTATFPKITLSLQQLTGLQNTQGLLNNGNILDYSSENQSSQSTTTNNNSQPALIFAARQGLIPQLHQLQNILSAQGLNDESNLVKTVISALEEERPVGENNKNELKTLVGEILKKENHNVLNNEECKEKEAITEATDSLVKELSGTLSQLLKSGGATGWLAHLSGFINIDGNIGKQLEEVFDPQMKNCLQELIKGKSLDQVNTSGLNDFQKQVLGLGDKVIWAAEKAPKGTIKWLSTAANVVQWIPGVLGILTRLPLIGMFTGPILMFLQWMGQNREKLENVQDIIKKYRSVAQEEEAPQAPPAQGQEAKKAA